MLFSRPTLIIYLSRTKIVIGDASISWDGHDLAAALSEYLLPHHSGTFHIVLDPDVSYTIHFPKPAVAPNRQEVFSSLTSYIPEIFVLEQFDWRLLLDGSIEAIVIQTPIFSALRDLKTAHPALNFETQSALSLLLEMTNVKEDQWVSCCIVSSLIIHSINGTPTTLLYQSPLQDGMAPTQQELLRYAASRKYNTGPDAKIINVPILEKFEPIEVSKNTSPHQSPKRRFYLEGLLLIILLIATPLYVLSQYPNILTKPTNIPVTSPTASPVATPTTSTKTLVASDFSITVSNASGKTGVAKKYQDLLLGAGFINVEATTSANLSNISKIVLKDALPTEIQGLILKAIEPVTPSVSINPDATNDIFILIGNQ